MIIWFRNDKSLLNVDKIYENIANTVEQTTQLAQGTDNKLIFSITYEKIVTKFCYRTREIKIESNDNDAFRERIFQWLQVADAVAKNYNSDVEEEEINKKKKELKKIILLRC